MMWLGGRNKLEVSRAQPSPATEARAFAPPAIRRQLASRIDHLPRPEIYLPAGVRLEYRWRFGDGTVSAWRPAERQMILAPPAARVCGGCEWREVKVRESRARDPRSELNRLLQRIVDMLTLDKKTSDAVVDWPIRTE